jgi:hypothetical protein
MKKLLTILVSVFVTAIYCRAQYIPIKSIIGLQDSLTAIGNRSQNLLVDSLGTTGVVIVVPRNDTLFGRLARGQSFITVDTLAGGEMVTKLDTAASGLKAYILANGAGGISTLNTLTASTQTFATGTSGTDFTIVSSVSTHTFNIPDASASGRGFMSTGTQTIVGTKTFNGLTIFPNGLVSSAAAANANLYVGSGSTGSPSSTSRNLFAGASTVAARIFQSGSTNYGIAANNSYAHMVIGGQDVTEAASGTHAMIAGFVVIPPAITGGVATVTNTATIYITGPPSATVTGGNYSLAVESGISKFGGGLQYPYVSKAADYTATTNDRTIEITATGKTITLPTAAGISGYVYTIKLTASSATGTVATTSSQTIDGSTTYSLSAQYKYVTVQSNGTNWIIIANN